MGSRLVFLTLLLSCVPTGGERCEEPASVGVLTDDQVIASEALGYNLQYRVYLPAGHEKLEALPVLYVVDGQWYIEPGELPRLMDRLIEKGRISPALAVFVDNRDPDDLGVNRRNEQFFCNRSYAAFFTDELIPSIDERYPTLARRDGRVVLGLSFGGLNAACFGLLAHRTFGGIAMQSPALHPVPGIYDEWERAPHLPLRVFLSTGTYHDNEESSRRLRGILEMKGYDLAYVETPYGHNWRNWKPLLDDVLLFFFSLEEGGAR